MPARIDSIRGTYTTIPEMGRDATRRVIPGAQLRRYFDSLRAAYECAGLRPQTGDSLMPREGKQVPGFKEGHDELQVALAINRAGYIAGRYYAVGGRQQSAVHADIVAKGDEFKTSYGFALPEKKGYLRVADEQPFEFELTRGQDGSLRMLSNFIMEKADSGLFVPVEPSFVLTSGTMT